jgi:ferritin-like metal-binding protein YciE
MSLQTMNDLLIEQLHDLRSGERQYGAALPSLLDAATNDALADALRERLLTVDPRVDRLSVILEALGAVPDDRRRCRAMEGLVLEADALLGQADEDFVLDAGLVAQAQRMEQHLFAIYSAARGMAAHLQRDRLARVLEDSAVAQMDSLRALAEVAEHEVHPRATAEARAAVDV